MVLRGAEGLNTRDPASPAAATWRIPGPAFPGTQTHSASIRLPRGSCCRPRALSLPRPGDAASLPLPAGSRRHRAAASPELLAAGGTRPPAPSGGRAATPAPPSKGNSPSRGPDAHPQRRWGRSRPRRSSPFSRRGPGLPPPPLSRAEGPAESRGSALAAAISCSLCARRRASRGASRGAQHRTRGAQVSGRGWARRCAGTARLHPLPACLPLRGCAGLCPPPSPLPPEPRVG